MLGLSAEDRREKALRAWWRWYRAKRKRDRDAAIFDLWSLCEPEVWHAAAELAKKLGEATKRHITVLEWLVRHGLDEDDIRYAAFPAVAKAAKGYDPHAGASFQTYAYSFILGELRSSIVTRDALNLSGELPEVAESEETIEGQLDMWSLFELDSHNGGLGKYSDRGALLESLDADTLTQIRNWLEENKERAIEAYGFGEWSRLALAAGFGALAKQLPPSLCHASPFADKPKDGLPLQAVAIRADGKTWNLALPIRAEILRRQGLSGRAIAELLGLPWSTYRELRTRIDKRDFSLDRFTVDDLDVVARGNQGRKLNS